MNILSPYENPSFFGHREVLNELQTALQTGRVHHAWLFTGRSGIGKATLACRFARILLARVPLNETLALNPDHPVFKKIAARTHPDFLAVEREWDDKKKRYRSEIVVESVRKIIQFLHLTAAESGWRVILIDGADAMNRSAANALLKLLEEPPPRSVFLLIAEGTSGLPTTVLSRCRQIKMRPLSESETLSASLSALGGLVQDEEGEEIKNLLSLAGGSPGRLLQIADKGGRSREVFTQVLSVFNKLPNISESDTLIFADKLSGDADDFDLFIEFARNRLADITRENILNSGLLSSAGGQKNFSSYVDVWQELGKLKNDVENFQPDRRVAVLSALSLLRKLP